MMSVVNHNRTHGPYVLPETFLYLHFGDEFLDVVLGEQCGESLGKGSPIPGAGSLSSTKENLIARLKF